MLLVGLLRLDCDLLARLEALDVAPLALDGVLDRTACDLGEALVAEVTDGATDDKVGQQTTVECVFAVG